MKIGNKIMLNRLKLYLLTFALAALIFNIFPKLDIWFSSLFFENGHFFLYNNPVVVAICRSAEVAVWILSIGLISLLVWKNNPFALNQKMAVFLLIVLILGPGLVVNVIFKEHWGRARPGRIEEFGGVQKFTRAFVISDQCETNCAFVSGHASIGFYFVAFGFVWRAHRKKIITAAAIYGALIGLGRIMRGVHFLSDIVFSFFFVYITAFMVYELMFVWPCRNKSPS